MKRLKGSVSRRKKIILIMSVALLLATLLLRIYEYRNKRELRQELREEQVAVPDSGTEKQREPDVSDYNTEWSEISPVNDPEKEQKQEETGIRIKNLNVYADALLGKNKELLTKSLEDWCTANQVDVYAAEMIHVMYDQENPDKLLFYVRLNDTLNDLVVLTCDRAGESVTTDRCYFTEEEVMGEVWEGNEPAEQDVSMEKEEAFLLEQEEADESE